MKSRSSTSPELTTRSFQFASRLVISSGMSFVVIAALLEGTT